MLHHLYWLFSSFFIQFSKGEILGKPWFQGDKKYSIWEGIHSSFLGFVTKSCQFKIDNILKRKKNGLSAHLIIYKYRKVNHPLCILSLDSNDAIKNLRCTFRPYHNLNIIAKINVKLHSLFLFRMQPTAFFECAFIFKTSNLVSKPPWLR